MQKVLCIVGIAMLGACDAVGQVEECTFSRCGGDPIGHWVAAAAPTCLGPGDWAALGDCESVDTQVTVTPRGTMDFRLDGTHACSLDAIVEYQVRVAKACRPELQASGCHVLEPLLDPTVSALGLAFACEGEVLDSDCVCHAQGTIATGFEEGSGTFKTSDGYILMNGATDPATEGRPYCIEADGRMKLQCPGADGKPLPMLLVRQ
ncbi:MAG: hypothetical protein U1F43_21020 [Myxococcota bacterium]